jgi:hypothetical protein
MFSKSWLPTSCCIAQGSQRHFPGVGWDELEFPAEQVVLGEGAEGLVCPPLPSPPPAKSFVPFAAAF